MFGAPYFGDGPSTPLAPVVLVYYPIHIYGD